MIWLGGVPNRVHADPDEIAQDRSIPGHVDQQDIESGRWTIADLDEAGRRLFVAPFTKADGVGRPAALGNLLPRRRPLQAGTEFIRSAGPDANACSSCHVQPDIGGAGDFVANVFLGLSEQNPAKFTIESSYSNERGTPDLHGVGVIELLAREITRDLHAIRDAAIEHAKATGDLKDAELVSKGISFGSITVTPEGDVDSEGVVGIDHDLIIRPFGSKGTVVSIREFTITAANLHHGMQADERFGEQHTGWKDFDDDGVSGELTTGDITALSVFQAMLNVPGQVLPADPESQKQIARGEALFKKVDCHSCHVPELKLDSPLYTEPNPFNYVGTLRENDVSHPLTLDLSTQPASPRIQRADEGGYQVRLFTDFKRHIIADRERPHFGNETVVQRRLDTQEFVTKKLWSIGSTAPYGHRGDITTLREAIEHHGGEANPSRQRYDALPVSDQNAIIEFLKSLQIVPPGSPPQTIQPAPRKLPYAASIR